MITDRVDQHVAQVLDGETAGWLRRLLQSRAGVWIIAAISFIESALPIPIITDPFIVAAILANRKQTALLVVVSIASSVVGGLMAFLMALFFFDVIAAHMTENMSQQFAELGSFGHSDTFVTSIAGAVTPVPYTITAWFVAVAGGSLSVFLFASVIGRGVRYGIIGYCAYLFGPAALRYARRSLTITSIIILALIAVYIWLKL